MDFKMELDNTWHGLQWPWVQTLGISLSVPREFNVLLKGTISSLNTIWVLKEGQ